MTSALQAPLQPGDPAPDFLLPAVDRDATVSLADYRHKSALLLALFRGLYCPFCRRAIAQMSHAATKLRPLGIESLAVVATDLENARLYFKFRPVRVALAADPELTTHRSYRVPKPEPTPEIFQQMQSVRVNPTGEFPEPLTLPEAASYLDSMDGFQPTDTDRRDMERQLPLLKGQFLIDPEGVIRWVNIEGARDGLAGMGRFPSEEELLAAVQLVR